MFNDVHLAKVSKINKTTEWMKSPSKKTPPSNPNFPGSRNKESDMHLNITKNLHTSVETTADFEDAMRKISEHGFIFGSTSPRCGNHEIDSPGLEKQKSLSSVPPSGESTDCTQKDNNESDNNISSCSTLDIVNKVENLSLLELEAQIKKLSQRLNNAENQRDDLQHKLDECIEEKELCYRRLEVISSAHESRITEMHGVIAELSKKLRTKQETTILEENEAEGSEISYQDESVYNSEMNLTNPDAECQTDPLDGNYSMGGLVEDENPSTDIGKDLQNYNETVVKSKVETLQEEVLHLKAQIALLQSEIAESSQHVDQNELTRREKSILQFCDPDVEASELKVQQEPYTKINEQSAVSNSEKNVIGSLLDHSAPVASPQAATIVPKMAERVKLRDTKENCIENITASDLLKTEMSNSGIVEHLVSGFFQGNTMLGSFLNVSDIDIEFQRLQRKIEQLRMKNVVLSLTLNECKEHCDQLYLLCGKYESNAIALQSAVNCSDRAIEAYDVMLALLESKIALMKEKSEATEESRRAVESVARHLLIRLDSEKNLNENSLGPWKNTFSFSDKTITPWTSEDDNRLRYHVSKLKGRRSTVQNTIVNLESPFSAFYEKSRIAIEESKEYTSEKNAQMDLETAVLMQELMNLREENVQLKYKAEEAERDRQFAVDKINILQDDLQQLQMQISIDSDVLFNTEDHLSITESDHAALMERQLVEALSRESELKRRIQSLIATVSDSSKSSNEKYQQVQNNIKDLQRINLNLSQTVEYNKRKYQSKIRKLEQKICEMNTELTHYRNIQKPYSEPQKGHRKFKSHVLVTENVPETIL